MSRTGKPLSFAGGYDEVVISGGTASYLLEGELHRTDGPAKITATAELWYLNGQLVGEVPA